MPNTNLPNSNAQTGNTCSRANLDHLSHQLEGYEAELLGHERNGHTRSVLGPSFAGRKESEIQADIDRVQEQLIQCNNQL